MSEALVAILLAVAGLGFGVTFLPGMGEDSSAGALSLVTKSLDPWGVFSGCRC